MTVAEKKESILKLLAYTPGGLAKWLRMKLTGREVAVVGECLQCGRCCRSLNLSYGDRWVRREKDFLKMKQEYPEYERFHITGRTPTGLLIFECDQLTEDGLCGDHEGRPDLCRDYPENDLVFCGGELLEHCGYKFIETPSFSRMLSREIDADEPAPGETAGKEIL